MAISDTDLQKIRDELTSAARPLFFFDDDPDGLSSFLLLYRMVHEGKGVVVKATPELTDMFLPKVVEYQPDLIVVLDKPDVSQDFLDAVGSTKVIWIDHHEPKKRQNVKYYNPRIADDHDNRPTSYWCYKIAQNDQWIAMAGIVGDWFLPEFAPEFSASYPDLLATDIDTPEKALFGTDIGKLSRIFSFLMKGPTADATACIKVMTRIESPYEILRQESPAGKFIYKKYASVKKQYETLLSAAKKIGKKKDPILLFTYTDAKMSFTGDLSNELLYLFPKKIILIAREKSGEMKCSLRSASIKLEPILKKALEGVDGYGGGHEMACGACIKDRDWPKFLAQLKDEYVKAGGIVEMEPVDSEPGEDKG